MSEQPVGRLSGAESLNALADLAQLLTTCGTVAESISCVLRLLCQIFDGEGAIVWYVDESEQVLRRKQTYHQLGSRSKAFESEAAQQTVFFGDDFVGRAWAQGKPLLAHLPAMFRQEANPGERQEVRNQTVSCLCFPLYGSGTISGVLELVGCSIDRLTAEDELFLDIVACQLGAYIVDHDALLALQETRGKLENALEKMKQMEQELRQSKSRYVLQQDDLIRNAIDQRDFLTRVSRDIRTPLSGIMSIVELLERTQQTEKQSEYTQIIRESAGLILNVVQELVETTKTKTDRFCARVQQDAPPISADAEDAKTLTDAKVLVINGLVGSAENIDAYATACGISAQTVSRGRSGLIAMRQAASAGRPFDVVFVERVLPDMDAFEFARLVKDKHELAGSRLVLVSTFGEAAEPNKAVPAGFTAHMPKPTKQAQVINTVQAVLSGTSVAAAVQSPELCKVPVAVVGKRVILVAEDNPVNQKVALLQLQELGFYAEVVTNGKDAVRAAQRDIFDAILMDLQMPEMDGFEATRQIRQWEQGKQGTRVPIIAMTARALPNDREECMAAGMDDYMSKPVTYDKLNSVLSKWTQTPITSPNAQEGVMDKQNAQQIDFSPETAQNQAPAPVDLNMLADMLGEEEAAEILKLFVESSEELLDRINDALTSHDGQALREAAHTLKGACSSIGAGEMWRECIELEQAAKSDDWGKIPETYSALAQSFDQAKQFILKQ